RAWHLVLGDRGFEPRLQGRLLLALALHPPVRGGRRDSIETTDGGHATQGLEQRTAIHEVSLDERSAAFDGVLDSELSNARSKGAGIDLQNRRRAARSVHSAARRGKRLTNVNPLVVLER